MYFFQRIGAALLNPPHTQVANVHVPTLTRSKQASPHANSLCKSPMVGFIPPTLEAPSAHPTTREAPPFVKKINDTPLLMGRWHLLELHEQVWFPAALRDLVVESLRLAWTEMPAPGHSLVTEGALPVVRSVLKQTKSTAIVDVCSGGGGPMPCIAKLLNVPVTLTDLFPQVSAWERIRFEEFHDTEVGGPNDNGLFSFVAEPVDATKFPLQLCQPNTLRTFCLSLHHFQPSLARRIIADAVAHKTPIVILESQERTWWTMTLFLITLIPGIWLLWLIKLAGELISRGFIPFVSALWSALTSSGGAAPPSAGSPLRCGTPRRRARGLYRPGSGVVECIQTFAQYLIKRWFLKRVLWTLILPVVPFVVWFDGLVSCLRTYTKEEFLNDIVGPDRLNDAFEWTVTRKYILGVAVSIAYVGVPKSP